ncbi:MAG: hypothetical protein U0636_04225 [Phycisphaerales bacterium]
MNRPTLPTAALAAAAALTLAPAGLADSFTWPDPPAPGTQPASQPASAPLQVPEGGSQSQGGGAVVTGGGSSAGNGAAAGNSAAAGNGAAAGSQPTTVAEAIHPEPQPAFTVSGGYLHQFWADSDNGAQMSADRFYASFGARLLKTEDFSLSMAMSYEFDWYHWQGRSTLGVRDPFGSVNLFALQLRGAYKLGDQFTIGVGGIFGIAGETNADVGDSIYGGGIATFAWTPSEKLTLGIGLLGVTQIEDDPLIIPVPVIDWKFDKEWSISTMRRPPASPFVGLDLCFDPEGSNLDFRVGVAWQQRRFRLGNSNVASINNGVGEDQSWAMLFAFGYKFSSSFRVDVVTGFNFYEKLQLENSQGGQPRDVTVDPSGLLGVFATFKF